MRFSLPVYRLDEGVAGFRKRLWTISLSILALTGVALSALLSQDLQPYRTPDRIFPQSRRGRFPPDVSRTNQ